MRAAGAGPVVWSGIIAATCLLLFLLQKVLWLVVPFLLAMVIYYCLRPAMQRLALAGIRDDTAAFIVGGGFIVLLLMAGVWAAPWLTARMVFWQESLERYVGGGLLLLQNSLTGLESQFAFLRRAHLADTVSARMASLSDAFVQQQLPGFILGMAAWLPAILLAPFLVFFFLRDGRRFKAYLGRAVPNAFFERTLNLLYEVDWTARLYFQGLMALTLLDTLALALGLWVIGVSSPLLLGFTAAVLAWVPYVGSIVGCLMVVLVAATDAPHEPFIAYSAVGVFILVRMLDDFVFMPLTIGRSLRIHPLITVLMIFAGGAIAGVAGLMLALPLLGVVRVIGETVGRVVTDPRLRARHRHARALHASQASADL